jgi:hypothetical protein
MAKQTTKRVAPPKLQKQSFGMLPPRPIHPKERELYELNNDENFLLDCSVEANTIFHLPTFYFLATS